MTGPIGVAARPGTGDPATRRRDEPEPDGARDVYAEAVVAFEEVALLATNERVPLDDVLRRAGRRLCELLGVSRCSVYLRRADGRFQGRVGYCAGRRDIDAGVRRLVSGGEHDLFTAEVVGSASPVVVQGAMTDPRTIHRTMRRWGVRDMLGVPLVVDGEVIGIIYMDNEAREHLYTTRDIRLAQAFAGLVAIAVRQAWVIQQLAHHARTIEHQRTILGASQALYSRLTHVLLDGAEIGEMLGLIAEMLGKPVVLYDPALTVVSWAAPPSLALAGCPGLTAAQRCLPQVRRVLADLDGGSSSSVLRAGPELGCRRLFVRMVVDGACAGYLELCELGGGFSPTDAKALEQAAMAVALKLLAEARRADALRYERADYLSDLLHGRRDPARLADEAAALGFDVQKRHLVLRLRYAGAGTGDAASSKRRDAVADAVGRHLAADTRCVAHTGIVGEDLLLIEVPAAGEAWEAGFRVRLATAFDELARVHGAVHAVASEPCRALADLPTQAERARELAGLLGYAGDASRLAFARDFELVRLVNQRDGLAGAQRHAENLLAPLVAHDAATGSSLVETIAAYLECQARIRSTAAALDVHENTVRYRLNRIRELSAIDPERVDSLFGAYLAVQVLRLFGGPAGLSRSPIAGGGPTDSDRSESKEHDVIFNEPEQNPGSAA
ncbi:GAF domain-containing protein [Phytohabitans sp. ZYX-F-186]|uniref:GAF domain-containing protein n=1 Tax=Phytohabitans maris TaxID=3071409 RepID=A0ABU0ZRW3_9ACTN|nr:GAF domain-containing protein [Phytohabitans sp. ZYX-F-186]MDQ7909069.1 GAF domain-containing protein [Phytohabitans sp. ZYX-F-186]